MARVQSHAILCALSDLKARRPNGPNCYTYKAQGFAFGEVRDEYFAYHTNEGPVKLLLDKANRAGNRIDRVVYLCSGKCKNDVVELKEGTFTAEEFFKSRISSYVRDELGLDWIEDERSFFTPITYEVGDADNCIGNVVSVLGDNTVVDVDVSGAQRDAQLLIAHAIEFMQIGSDNVRLGTAVYANFNSEPKTLTCLDNTYQLSRLIGSIDSFVRYGRADGLAEYFANGREDVRELCDNMSDFAADLALCRVAGIQDEVTRVHESFDRLENRTTASDLSSGETLLVALVPSMRAGFVERAHVPFDQTLAIIRWCVKHNMLQQALSLYRENFFTLLSQKGWLGRGSEATGDNDIAWHEKLLNLASSWVDSGVCYYLQIGVGENGKLNRCKSRIMFNDTKSMNVIKTDSKGAAVLCANFAWFYLLRTIRNDVMHANVETGIDIRLQFIGAVEKVMGCREGFSPRYDRSVKRAQSRSECNRALSDDILEALSSMEGKGRLWPELN